MMSYALRENGDGTCNATRKQMSYLKALMAEVYSEEEIEVFVGDGLTKDLPEGRAVINERGERR